MHPTTQQQQQPHDNVIVIITIVPMSPSSSPSVILAHPTTQQQQHCPHPHPHMSNNAIMAMHEDDNDNDTVALTQQCHCCHPCPHLLPAHTLQVYLLWVWVQVSKGHTCPHLSENPYPPYWVQVFTRYGYRYNSPRYLGEYLCHFLIEEEREGDVLLSLSKHGQSTFLLPLLY